MRDGSLTDAELDALLYASSPYDGSTEPAEPGRSSSTQGEAEEIAGFRRRRWIAPALAVAATVAVVAVVVQSFWIPRDATGTVATSPSPTTTTSIASRSELPQGLLGTGELLSPDGRTSGRVEISLEGGDLWFRVLDLVTPYETVILSGSMRARGDDWCVDSGGYAFSGSVATSSPIAASVPASIVTHGDPTSFDEVDLYVSEGSGNGSDCIYQSVARAPIKWTVAPLRTHLASVTDSGDRDGARGAVEHVEGGQEVYVVAPDDRLDDVAERFGVTRDDLFYLNESRMPNPEDPVLYVGERLNLSLGFR